MKQFKDYTFTAKHKLSGNKIDATQAVMELYASVDAWKEAVEEQQAILVDCVNRLERIQKEVAEYDREYCHAHQAIAEIKKVLEQE
jgi:chromosome segregation ATPase